jgi:hypothetical protein
MTMGFTSGEDEEPGVESERPNLKGCEKALR